MNEFTKAAREYAVWERYEDTVQRRALELCKDCGPEYNIAPLLQLIRDADALGYAVVRATSQFTFKP